MKKLWGIILVLNLLLLGSVASGLELFPFGGKTDACVTGFTRTSPNFCRRNDLTAGTEIWTNATACTSHSPTVITLPATTTWALLLLNFRALSNNVAGQIRDNGVTFWGTSTCVSPSFANARFSAFEFSAVVAGTEIGRGTFQVLIPVVVTNTFYTTQSTLGGNGNSEINTWGVLGYFD